MSKNFKLKPIAATVGVALTTSVMAMPTANADANPFGLTELSSGYMVAGGHKSKEGKCGCSEGKCGGKSKHSEGKHGEGKHSKSKHGASKGKEGKCGEGKCGEGKCGGA